MSTNNLANEIHSWVNALNIHASKSATLEAENEVLKKELNGLVIEKNTLASDNVVLKRDIENLKNERDAERKIALLHVAEHNECINQVKFRNDVITGLEAKNNDNLKVIADLNMQNDKYIDEINILNKTISNFELKSKDQSNEIKHLGTQIAKRDSYISRLTDEIDNNNQSEETTKNVNEYLAINSDKLTEFIKDQVKNAFANMSQALPSSSCEAQPCQWFRGEYHKSSEPAIDRTTTRVNLDVEFAALYQACAISHAVKGMADNLEALNRFGIIVNAFSKHIDTIKNTITDEAFINEMVTLIFYRPMNELIQIYTKLGLKTDDLHNTNDRFEILRAMVGIDGGVFFEALRAKMPR